MESWISRALPSAVAYASSLLGDRSRGEDIVQDCVCRLLAAAARYDLERDGQKLLFRSITNASINARARARRTVSLDEHGRQPEGGTWQVEDPNIVSPPEGAMAEELRRAIGAGLASLPVRYRSVIELSSLGYAAEEIAEVLEVKPGSVRVILFRARRAMASYLNARFPGEVSS